MYLLNLFGLLRHLVSLEKSSFTGMLTVKFSSEYHRTFNRPSYGVYCRLPCNSFKKTMFCIKQRPQFCFFFFLSVGKNIQLLQHRIMFRHPGPCFCCSVNSPGTPNSLWTVVTVTSSGPMQNPMASLPWNSEWQTAFPVHPSGLLTSFLTALHFWFVFWFWRRMVLGLLPFR